MKNVLIVDSDDRITSTLTDHLKRSGDRYSVFSASGSTDALKLLENREIDLVVIGIRMPGMKGLDLLTHLNNRFFHLPAIVMSESGAPKVRKMAKEMGFALLTDNPVDFDALVLLMEDELKCISQSGHVNSISISSFLQFIEMEEKTCFLKVAGKNGANGFLYFKRGILYDALCSDLKGEDAVLKMLLWKKPEISFQKLLRKKIKRRITSSVPALIIKNSRLADESDRTDNRRASDDAGDAAAADPEKKQAGSFGEKFEGSVNFKGFLGLFLFDTNGVQHALPCSGGVDPADAGPLVATAMLGAKDLSTRLGPDAAHTIYFETATAQAFSARLNQNGYVSQSGEEEEIWYLLMLASTEARTGLVKKMFAAAAGHTAEMIKNGFDTI